MSLGLKDNLRNKLELPSAIYYAQIQSHVTSQASISFMALEKRLQTETALKSDLCLFMQIVYAKIS